MINCGAVVVVDFFPTNPDAQVRPALVVQNDRDNSLIQKTIVAEITSNIGRARLDTQLLIDENHPDWKQSGLHRPSVVTCSNIGTIAQDDIVSVLGSLSAQTMNQIDECLKAALDIP